LTQARYLDRAYPRLRSVALPRRRKYGARDLRNRLGDNTLDHARDSGGQPPDARWSDVTCVPRMAESGAQLADCGREKRRGAESQSGDLRIISARHPCGEQGMRNAAGGWLSIRPPRFLIPSSRFECLVGTTDAVPWAAIRPSAASSLPQLSQCAQLSAIRGLWITSDQRAARGCPPESRARSRVLSPDWLAARRPVLAPTGWRAAQPWVRTVQVASLSQRSSLLLSLMTGPALFT
jgi:hypothetical protein